MGFARAVHLLGEVSKRLLAAIRRRVAFCCVLMAIAALALICSLVSCGAGPLATDYELAQNSHADQVYALQAVERLGEAVEGAGLVIGDGWKPDAPQEGPPAPTGTPMDDIIVWVLGGGIAQSLIRRMLRSTIGFDPLDTLADALTLKGTRDKRKAKAEGGA